MAFPSADGTHHVTLANGRHVVVKQRHDVPAGFFEAEAHGLTALRRIGAMRIPEVFEVAAHRIVLEDMGHGERARDYWQLSGAGLARQHSAIGTRFGFDQNGFCGDSPQDNTPEGDGWKFFATRRLLPQTRRARERGLIDEHHVARIESLCAALRERIPDMPPVLLHGDLWSGNLHICGDGSPALIDAGAVHYGWAESELAMLTLFGSPPDAFFRAYAEHAPLRHDWRTRAPFYNLYHLLNHVNLFGTGYLPALHDSISASQAA